MLTVYYSPTIDLHLTPESPKIRVLKSQRLTIRTNRTKSTTRAPRTPGLTTLIRSKYPISGDYAVFLNSISQYNLELISNEADCFSAESAHYLISNQNPTKLYSITNQLILSAIKAIKQLEADKGKNAGAAIKRRKRAIESFKSARSDISMLLNSSRSAIAGTMRLRRYLQDTTDTNIKYIERKGKVKSFASKAYLKDKLAIELILNPDVEQAYESFKIMTSAYQIVNNLVTRYNLALTVKEQ